MTVSFQSLDILPVGLSFQDVVQAFAPFRCTGDAAAVRSRQLRLICWNAAKRAWRRATGAKEGAARSKTIIKGEYEGAWSRGFAAYDLSAA